MVDVGVGIADSRQDAGRQVRATAGEGAGGVAGRSDARHLVVGFPCRRGRGGLGC